MANFDSRTYSKTFWIIFGSSKAFTKSGPLHSLFITKALQRIQEQIPEHLQSFFYIPGLPTF